MKKYNTPIITGFLALLIAFFSTLIYYKYFILLGLDEKTHPGAVGTIFLLLLMVIAMLIIITIYLFVIEKTKP